MQKRMFTLFLLGCSAMFGQVSFGLQIGPPPPPRVMHARPRAPGPGFVWVDGYWYPEGGRYRWHNGYWTRPPYEGATWVGPRHDGQRFFEGHWEGDRGRRDHDHRWDRDRERDHHDRDDHDRDRDRR